MEIRLVTRDKGRIKNVEIYDEEEFYILVKNLIVTHKVSFLDRLFNTFKTELAFDVTSSLKRIFTKRLKENRNR